MLIEENLPQEAKEAISKIAEAAKRRLQKSRGLVDPWDCANCSHLKPDDRLWLCDSASRWSIEEDIRSNIHGLTVCVDVNVECPYFNPNSSIKIK